MKFSVVIPTYNSARTIGQTIESILDQTFKDWELMLVDDGSTDETITTLDTFSKKDSRIKYFPRPNDKLKGANACRNFGIGISTGDFIGLIDSDDHWKSQRIERVVNNFENNPDIKGTYSGAIISSENGLIKRKSRSLKQNESHFDFLIDPDTFSQTSSFAFRKDTKVLFDESLKRHQDFDYFIRFGDKHKWSYFENFDVVVNWEGTEVFSTDFESCLKLYNQQKNQIVNKHNELLYLFKLWSQAYNRSEIKYMEDYKLHMLSLRSYLGLTDKIVSTMPLVSYKIYNFIKSLSRQ
jgi:glycosyltransferase involved in cell wall biosynthesis